MRQVHDAAILADEAVDDMRMRSPALNVQDAGTGLIGHVELGLEIAEPRRNRVGMIPTWRRIDMKMVKGFRGAAVGSISGKLAQLSAEIGGSEESRLDKPNVLTEFRGEQMSSKGRTTRTPRCTRKHERGLTSKAAR